MGTFTGHGHSTQQLFKKQDTEHGGNSRMNEHIHNLTTLLLAAHFVVDGWTSKL